MTNRPWYVIVGYFLISIALIGTIVLFLYRVRGILPPFIIAFAIAWLLDPLLDRLQERGCPRLLAVSGVYIIFLAAFISGLIYLIPLIGSQARQLSMDFPEYARRSSEVATGLIEEYRPQLAKVQLPTSLQEAFAEYGERVTHAVKSGIEIIGSWLVSNLGKLLWVILIPLVAFYFLNDIDRMRAKAVLFIPEAYRKKTVFMLSRMGAVFSGYIRGLVVVCLLYGITTSLILYGLHIKYWVILGVVAGILYAVPYIGAILTTVLVFIVGWATYGSGLTQPLIAAGAMVAANQFFDLLITPKILGKSVGLHPVISLFALLAGGSLFGLVGMILAVPIAASIQEVVLELYPGLRVEPKLNKKKSADTLRKHIRE